LRPAFDERPAVAREADPRRRRSAQARIGRGRHAETDQFVAFAALSRFVEASLPTNEFRAAAVAFEQMLARKRQPGRFIVVGMVAHP